MTDGETIILAINPVLEERADDFEEWLRAVVLPAMRTHQPELVDRVMILRATEVVDGTITFAFLATGGEPADWELEPLLERALGSHGAAQAMSEMSGMLQKEQYGWSVRRVPFHDSVPEGCP